MSEEENEQVEKKPEDDERASEGSNIFGFLSKLSIRIIPALIAAFAINVLIVSEFFNLHAGFHVVNAYEKGVRFRLGKFSAIEEPGLHFAIPVIDRVHILKTWEHVIAIPTQSVATKDLVTLSLDAVLRYVIVDPQAIVVAVDDADRAGTEITLAAIKEAVGEVSYEKLISDRRDINERIRTVVDSKVQPWGLSILGVEIKKSIPVDPEVQRALAKRAIAEQERLARLVIGQSEVELAEHLLKASQAMTGGTESAMRLRYFHTLEKFSQINTGNFLFPLSIDPDGQPYQNPAGKKRNRGIVERIIGNSDDYQESEADQN